jgi:hypothetical protein
MADPLDRVLRTRLESVEIMLATINELSKDVTSARAGLDDLKQQIQGLVGQIIVAANEAGRLGGELEEKARHMRGYESLKKEEYLVSADALSTLQTAADDLKRLLGRAQNAATTAFDTTSSLCRWDAVPDDRSIDAAELRLSARALRAELSQTVEAASPWAHYSATVARRCDDLLGGYVDLLSGIALRDHGLDREVSRFADKLVPTLLLSFGGTEAMALPTRHAAQWLIHTEHLRIPLPPGWTLWSLPLIARGVGELLRRRHGPDSDLLSEVFATYILGPAYAFAAILLELDPTGSADVLDAQRAQVILAVLEHLDQGDDNSRFTALAGTLRSEWESAVSVAWASDRPPDIDGATIRDLIEQVAFRCEKGAYLAAEQWDGVEQIAEQLVADDCQPDADPEFRDVLNAMWLARWRQPDRANAIFANASAFAESVIKASGSKVRQDRPAPTARVRAQ